MFGDLANYSFKELYDTTLKATQKMKIGNRTFYPNEVITEFDKIEISYTQELRTVTQATGGYYNRMLVDWSGTQGVDFSFSQGVFSNIQFGLLTNARIMELAQEEETRIRVPKKELLETDEDGKFVLEYKPIGNSLFVYQKDTGARYEELTQLDEKEFQVAGAYTDLIVRYEYEYENGSKIFVLGKQLITEYLRLEGKTKFKDDDTGGVVTGLIVIPKLKLTSGLSMILGTGANPVVGNFQATGYPVGVGYTREVMSLVVLEDEIDSDML